MIETSRKKLYLRFDFNWRVCYTSIHAAIKYKAFFPKVMSKCHRQLLLIDLGTYIFWKKKKKLHYVVLHFEHKLSFLKKKGQVFLHLQDQTVKFLGFQSEEALVYTFHIQDASCVEMQKQPEYVSSSHCKIQLNLKLKKKKRMETPFFVPKTIIIKHQCRRYFSSL